ASVSAVLLTPTGLAHDQLGKVFSELAGPGIDAADLYFQNRISEAWVLEEGIVKEGNFNLDQGVGVRAMAGEKTGFSYSNALTLPALLQAAQASRSIAQVGQQVQPVAIQSATQKALYPADNPLEVISREQKVALLKEVDAATRALDSRISQVTVSLTGSWEQVLVATLDGRLAADIRPLVRFNVSVIIEHNGRRERGTAGGGGRSDYRYFLAEERAMG